VYNYKYLIIGGGMTADAAVGGIREIDAEGSIGLVSLENDPPYKRPPLSKGLWKGKSPDSIWSNTESKRVTLHLGRRIVSLDADKRVAVDDLGNEFHGDKLLLAIGGRTRHLPFGEDNILYYRTLDDYRRLFGMSKTNRDFTVIGGGFIGAEISAALAMNGKKVTMLFPEDGIGARMYPNDLSLFLNDFYRKKGVEVLPGEQVTGLSIPASRPTLNTASGLKVTSDGILAGIGIELNIELAKAAGLQTDNGISVDEYLVTSHANIYAAGDVAEFFNPALGKRIRVEHEDNAKSMGRQAGRNMAGASEAYRYLPYFYSDLFELGFEAVGELDSRLTTAADWAEPFQKGIIYYFRENRISGVLLWNTWDKVPMARELIAQPGPFRPEDLKAKTGPGWKIIF
jgi:3-phenylpropionate/trans-cinnamate dioxygenase ferredoxin reductase component